MILPYEIPREHGQHLHLGLLVSRIVRQQISIVLIRSVCGPLLQQPYKTSSVCDGQV